MKINIFDGFWTVDDVKQNTDILFIYGDNDKKTGKKGQAIIRNETNAIGIPTKKYPSMKKDAFYNDDEYEMNKIKINTAIELIYIKLKTGKYKSIYMPENNFGTGLAQLEIHAPKTFKYLNKQIEKMIDNIENNY